MEDSLPPILEEPFAVIIPATFNGDVRWDREHQQWLAEDRYGKGWRIQEPPAGESLYELRVRVPDPDGMEQAVEAV